PVAVEQGLQAARERPGLYRMVLNFLAAQLASSTDPAQQAQLRVRAREIAREALRTISNPSFAPPPDNPAEPMAPIRTKTRMLFDLTCTLSALLAQPTQESYSSEDRALLRNYFAQIQAGMEQTRELSQRDPQSTPFPEYFEHFVQAQGARLSGNTGEA